MMITPQILSIPPYLSTPWKEIALLYAIPEEGVVERFQLIVMMRNKVRVVVPRIDRPTIEQIFEGHARFGQQAQPTTSLENIDFFNFALQHNPEQANAPDLPKEMVEKIASIGKTLGGELFTQIPKFEPHCNCPFCQIARVLSGEKKEEDEETVSDEELSFRSWNIEQSAEKLYQVSNPLDKTEYYSVYLGDPLGCTCGEKNCEHIRAVLNT
jgi:hypothetical protein